MHRNDSKTKKSFYRMYTQTDTTTPRAPFGVKIILKFCPKKLFCEKFNPVSNEIQGRLRRFYFFQRTFSNSQWTPTGFALDYSLVFLCKVFKERKFSGKLLISCGIKKFNKRKKNTITVAFAAAEAKSCVG